MIGEKGPSNKDETDRETLDKMRDSKNLDPYFVQRQFRADVRQVLEQYDDLDHQLGATDLQYTIVEVYELLESMQIPPAPDSLDPALRKAKIVTAILEETMPYPQDASAETRETLEHERFVFAMSSGLFNTATEELEQKWLQDHPYLPY